MAVSLGTGFLKSDPALDRPDIQFHIQPFSADSPSKGPHDFSAFTASVLQLRPVGEHPRVAVPWYRTDGHEAVGEHSFVAIPWYRTDGLETVGEHPWVAVPWYRTDGF